MNDYRFVVDTNILISRLLLPESIPAKVVRHIFKNGKVLLSDETLAELTSVLYRNKFDKYVSIEARKLFVEGLKLMSIHVEIVRTVKLCRDSKDNKFLDVVLNGSAKYLITGDQDLLVLKTFENTQIITAKDYSDLILGN